MSGQTPIRATDLEALWGVIESVRAVSDTPPAEDVRVLPGTLLSALRNLVPCDVATYQVIDPWQERWLDFAETGDDIGEPLEDTDEVREFFWSVYWASPACSYPQRTGNHRNVLKLTDFYSARELPHTPIGEWSRVNGLRWEISVHLPPDGLLDHRMLLWRADGPDFDERDRQLLRMVRPHLAEADLAIRAVRQTTPLTERQMQVLDGVAAGLTNRQIAKRLRVSEGTVRRHLENIFERLGVTSRTAAIANLDWLAGASRDTALAVPPHRRAAASAS